MLCSERDISTSINIDPTKSEHKHSIAIKRHIFSVPTIYKEADLNDKNCGDLRNNSPQISLFFAFLRKIMRNESQLRLALFFYLPLQCKTANITALWKQHSKKSSPVGSPPTPLSPNTIFFSVGTTNHASHVGTDSPYRKSQVGEDISMLHLKRIFQACFEQEPQALSIISPYGK